MIQHSDGKFTWIAIKSRAWMILQISSLEFNSKFNFSSKFQSKIVWNPPISSLLRSMWITTETYGDPLLSSSSPHWWILFVSWCHMVLIRRHYDRDTVSFIQHHQPHDVCNSYITSNHKQCLHHGECHYLRFDRIVGFHEVMENQRGCDSTFCTLARSADSLLTSPKDGD